MAYTYCSALQAPSQQSFFWARTPLLAVNNGHLSHCIMLNSVSGEPACYVGSPTNRRSWMVALPDILSLTLLTLVLQLIFVAFPESCKFPSAESDW